MNSRLASSGEQTQAVGEAGGVGAAACASAGGAEVARGSRLSPEVEFPPEWGASARPVLEQQRGKRRKQIESLPDQSTTEEMQEERRSRRREAPQSPVGVPAAKEGKS